MTGLRHDTCAVCGDPVNVVDLVDGTAAVLHATVPFPNPIRTHAARLPYVEVSA